MCTFWADHFFKQYTQLYCCNGRLKKMKFRFCQLLCQVSFCKLCMSFWNKKTITLQKKMKATKSPGLGKLYNWKLTGFISVIFPTITSHLLLEKGVYPRLYMFLPSIKIRVLADLLCDWKSFTAWPKSKIGTQVLDSFYSTTIKNGSKACIKLKGQTWAQSNMQMLTVLISTWMTRLHLHVLRMFSPAWHRPWQTVTAYL